MDRYARYGIPLVCILGRVLRAVLNVTNPRRRA
jgi:hypothetical protein